MGDQPEPGDYNIKLFRINKLRKLFLGCVNGFSPRLYLRDTRPCLSSPYHVNTRVSCITVAGTTPPRTRGSRGRGGPRATRATSQCRVQGTSSEWTEDDHSVTGLDRVNVFRELLGSEPGHHIGLHLQSTRYRKNSPIWRKVVVAAFLTSPRP